MDHVILVENVDGNANPNTIKNRFSCFGEVCSVGLHHRKFSLGVKNGCAFVRYQQAESARKAAESSGAVKVGEYKVDVCMLADAVDEHPFFEAMSLAVEEEPEFPAILHDNSHQNPKLAQSVVHLLQNRKYQNTFVGSFSRSLIVKNFSPGDFDAVRFNKKAVYLAKIVNFNTFWDYSFNTGFALIEFKSYMQAGFVARFMDDTEVFGSRIRLVRPETLFSSVDFTYGLYMKNPLSFSSSPSMTACSTVQLARSGSDDNSHMRIDNESSELEQFEPLFNDTPCLESTKLQQSDLSETGSAEPREIDISEAKPPQSFQACEDRTSVSSVSQIDKVSFDVNDDKIGTSIVVGDAIGEKPKFTDVTFKVSSRHPLDVKFQKVECDDRVLMKVTL